MRTNLHLWLDRQWSWVASALLHMAVGAAILVVLPSLLDPVTHSGDSEQVIPVEVEHLPSAAPLQQTPQPAPQPAAPAAAIQPTPQNPKSEFALPPPSPKPPPPKKITTGHSPRPSAPPVTGLMPLPLESQTAAPSAQANVPGESHDQVASPPSGRAGPSPDYLTKIRLQLERNKVYPRIAQLRHQQGTVVLSFVIDRSGHVLKHAIEQSSGYSVLDQEAEAILSRSGPLPPMPAEMIGSTLEIVVPLAFNLSDSSNP